MQRMVVVALALGALVLPAGARALSWPSSGVVLRPFEVGPNPYAASEHRGVDIGGPASGNVASAATGTVTFVGTVPKSGLVVTVATPDGYSVTLTHLAPLRSRKAPRSRDGQTVGTIGPSGDREVLEPYVHLGVRRAADASGYDDLLRLLPSRAAPTPEPTPAADPTPAPEPASAGAPPTVPAPAPVPAPQTPVASESTTGRRGDCWGA
jgi:murein DD-endopeptidase MepM/ murein hydrolase activator NlpD